MLPTSEQLFLLFVHLNTKNTSDGKVDIFQQEKLVDFLSEEEKRRHIKIVVRFTSEEKKTKWSSLCKRLLSNISVIGQQKWIVKISVMNWSSNRRHRTHVFWLPPSLEHEKGLLEKQFLIEIVCSYQTVISPSYVHYSSRKPLDLEEVLLCNVQSDNIQRLCLLVRSDQCHLTHENVVYIGKKRSASLQTLFSMQIPPKFDFERVTTGHISFLIAIYPELSDTGTKHLLSRRVIISESVRIQLRWFAMFKSKSAIKNTKTFHHQFGLASLFVTNGNGFSTIMCLRCQLRVHYFFRNHDFKSFNCFKNFFHWLSIGERLHYICRVVWLFF